MALHWLLPNKGANTVQEQTLISFGSLFFNPVRVNTMW